MKIGFIGFGEAAYNLALGLHGEGLSELYAYDTAINDTAIGRQLYSRAQTAQVTIVSQVAELAEHADVLFSAVPSSYAIEACQSILPYLHSKQLYADVSASTPQVKQTIGALLKGISISFADAAMMGSLPQNKHRVPILASGQGAEMFCRQMTPYGMNITVVSEIPGDASAIKLIRSIFMKGISALMIEMLRASNHYGVTQDIISSIAASMDGISFSSHLSRLVIGSAIHCHRRAAELSGSIDLLQEAGLPYEMTVAAKSCLEKLEPYHFSEQFASQKISEVQDVLNILQQ